jgi:hypothetical protein
MRVAHHASVAARVPAAHPCALYLPPAPVFGAQGRNPPIHH